MCDVHHYLGHAPGVDQYFVDHERVRNFIAEIRPIIRSAPDRETMVDRLKEPFARLLADKDWLPLEFQVQCRDSGMGGGIGQYLIFRDKDASMTLFSLVVPPGSATPIHDHLAWGLVGLYAGEQVEEVYELPDGSSLPPGADPGQVTLRRNKVRTLREGDFYPLLPPLDDIHLVRTISEQPSVSLHLLGNDAGCVWRHKFEPQHPAHGDAGTFAVVPFRSGYTNQPCPEEQAG